MGEDGKDTLRRLERKMKIFRIEDMPRKLICANENCASINGSKPINIKDILLIIGDNFKCPYCRGNQFKLIREGNTMEEDKVPEEPNKHYVVLETRKGDKVVKREEYTLKAFCGNLFVIPLFREDILDAVIKKMSEASITKLADIFNKDDFGLIKETIDGSRMEAPKTEPDKEETKENGK